MTGDEWRMFAVRTGGRMPMGARPFIWHGQACVVVCIRDPAQRGFHAKPANDNGGAAA